MGNRFSISGLGSELIRGRRDDNERDSESTRPSEEPHPILGTYSIYLSSPSRPEQEVSKDQFSEFPTSYNGAQTWGHEANKDPNSSHGGIPASYNGAQSRGEEVNVEVASRLSERQLTKEERESRPKEVYESKRSEVPSSSYPDNLSSEQTTSVVDRREVVAKEMGIRSVDALSSTASPSNSAFETARRTVSRLSRRTGDNDEGEI